MVVSLLYRRTNSVRRTRGVGERAGLRRFRPGRCLSGVMVACQEARPEEHDPRMTVGSVTFCMGDGGIWDGVRDFGCGGDNGSPWRARARQQDQRDRPKPGGLLGIDLIG
jgi:hypothetical protein